MGKIFIRPVKNKDKKITSYSYCVREVGPDSRLHWFSLGKVGEITKTVAEKRHREIRRKIDLGRFDELVNEIPTLSEFSKEYINYVRNVKMKRSWKKDKHSLGQLIEFFGDRKLAQITPEDIDAYKVKKLNEGYKGSSINRHLACLKHLYNLAIRWNRYFGVNPVTKVDFFQESEPEIKVMSLEEEKLLLENSDPVMRDFITIGLNTGMRKMEILSLKWEYIDLDKGIITLPQTNTKAKKKRPIPINSILRSLILHRKLLTGASQFVFPSDKSKNGHLTWIGKSFSRSVNRAKIEGITIHSLRDTFATRLFEAGENIVTVSKILGHSDVNLTIKRYINADNAMKGAVEKLVNLYHQV